MLRAIFDRKRHQITNSELYERSGLKPILYQLLDVTKKIFEVDKYKSSLTENSKEITMKPHNQRIKHWMVNYRVMVDDM